MYMYVYNRKEHQQHSSDCHFINNIKDPYNITVGDVFELEKSAAKMFIVSHLHVHCTCIQLITSLFVLSCAIFTWQA